MQAPQLTILEDPLADVLRQLDVFRTLAPDWDSYGAAPVTERAVRATRTLLRALADSQAGQLGPKLRPFAVGPLPSGGLQVDWRGPGGELEVEIEPDGTFGYLLVTGVEPTRHFEEAAITSRLQILKLISRVLEKAGLPGGMGD